MPLTAQADLAVVNQDFEVDVRARVAVDSNAGLVGEACAMGLGFSCRSLAIPERAAPGGRASGRQAWSGCRSC
jgi:hypothetical protein